MSRVGKVTVSAPVFSDCIAIFCERGARVLSCLLDIPRDQYEVCLEHGVLDEVCAGEEIPSYSVTVTVQDFSQRVEFKRVSA